MITMKHKWLPVFSVENCSGCRACVLVCLSGSLSIIDETVRFTNPEACLSEGRCVEECPMDGIHMDWLALEGGSTHGLVSD